MKKLNACQKCRQPVEKLEKELHGDDPRCRGLCTECRMKKEVESVIETMKIDYPKCRDYNVIDDGRNFSQYAEILDKNDKRIAVISDSQLDRYWNMMEGG